MDQLLFLQLISREAFKTAAMKLRLLLLCLLCVLTFPAASSAASESAGDVRALSAYESKLVAQVPGCTPIGRKNILLLWKPGIPLIFAAEARVGQLQQLADWLERAYGLMSDWTGHNPNDYWEKQTGQRNRLVFCVNGQRGFRFGGNKRPYVAIPLANLRPFDFESACQAMSHDFFSVPPDLRSRLGDSLEGACSYSSYHLLRAMEMPKVAESYEMTLYNTAPTDPVIGRARMLLDLERRLKLEGPAEFWHYFKHEDLELALFGTSASVAARPATLAGSLVAAWDFSGDAALTDKATAGTVSDGLKLLGDAAIHEGVAVVPAAKGAGLQALSSADLELTGEITLWARFRVMGTSKSIISLIDKRSFKPEQRSYAWLLVPSALANNAWAQGGQISADGTRATDVLQITGPPTVPVKAWREGAMVVRRVGTGCEMSWFVANRADELDMKYEAANAPVSSKTFSTIFRSNQPLFIGNDASLGANAATLEFAEVRIYNRALSAEELLLIAPGELSPNEDVK